MNHVFNFFTFKTIEKLRQLNKEKAIDDKTFIELTHTNSIKQIEGILRAKLNVREVAVEKIWLYFVNSWRWGKDKEKRVVFNERQNIFLKELINRGGIFNSLDCENSLLTSYQITEDVLELEDMDYVLNIEVKKWYGGKRYFVLNPKIIQEIKNGKS